MGFTIEPLEAVADGYVAHGQFFNKPTLITQMRCERHHDQPVEQDVIAGVRFYGLRKMLDGEVVGYALGTEITGVGTTRVDVRLYRLPDENGSER